MRNPEGESDHGPFPPAIPPFDACQATRVIIRVNSLEKLLSLTARNASALQFMG